MKKYIIIATLMNAILFNAMATASLFKGSSYSNTPAILTLDFKTPSGTTIKPKIKVYAGYYFDGVCKSSQVFISSQDVWTGPYPLTSDDLTHSFGPAFTCLSAEFNYKDKTYQTPLVKLNWLQGVYKEATPSKIDVDFTK